MVSCCVYKFQNNSNEDQTYFIIRPLHAFFSCYERASWISCVRVISIPIGFYSIQNSFRDRSRLEQKERTFSNPDYWHLKWIREMAEQLGGRGTSLTCQKMAQKLLCWEFIIDVDVVVVVWQKKVWALKWLNQRHCWSHVTCLCT